MASNQPTKAITVVPSDKINIPEPGSYLFGTNTGAGTTLDDATATFKTGTFNPAATGYSNRVAIGDVVYEPSTGTIAQVKVVSSNIKLGLTPPGLTGGAQYVIYKNNGGLANNIQGNEGFSLFVGTGGDLSVIPASSGDPVTLKNVGNNSYIPLQVIRVRNTDTTASDILALE